MGGKKICKIEVQPHACIRKRSSRVILTERTRQNAFFAGKNGVISCWDWGELT